MAFFSVVMATNIIDQFFFDAVQSIQNQSYCDFEFIVVVNGSARSFIGDDSRCLTELGIEVVCSEFRHLTAALNVGVHRAKGNYIVRMDADDIAHPDRLAILRQAIDEASNTPIVLYSDFDFIDGDGNRFENLKPLASLRSLRFRNVISHPTTAINRLALLDLGGYLGSIYTEDYDLWVRILRQYGVDGFHSIPDKLMWYRTDPTGDARGNRLAYFAMAGVQIRELLVTGHPAWALGAFESGAKGFWRGR